MKKKVITPYPYTTSGFRSISLMSNFCSNHLLEIHVNYYNVKFFKTDPLG